MREREQSTELSRSRPTAPTVSRNLPSSTLLSMAKRPQSAQLQARTDSAGRNASTGPTASSVLLVCVWFLFLKTAGHVMKCAAGPHKQSCLGPQLTRAHVERWHHLESPHTSQTSPPPDESTERMSNRRPQKEKAHGGTLCFLVERAGLGFTELTLGFRTKQETTASFKLRGHQVASM